VGIGTSAPADSLQVRNVALPNPNSSGSEVTGSSIGIGGNIHFVEKQVNGAFSDRTELAIITNTGYGLGESEKIRIDSSGRLGLGTSSPGGTLDVVADSGSLGINLRGRSADSIGTFSFYSNDGATNNAQIQMRPSDNELRYLVSGARSQAFFTNGAERVRISSTGAVGIGTTSPSNTLSVVSASSSIALFSGNNANNSIAVSDNNGTNFATFGSIDAGDAYIFSGTGKSTRLYAGNAERARIDSSGRLLVGTSTARANFFNASETTFFQVEGTGNTDASIIRNVDSTAGPNLIFGKSRGSANGSNTLVGTADQLGAVSFQGTDGSQFVEAASIQAFTDGTPGANDMPGRLVFSTTADGSASPTERLRIDSSGRVGIGTTNPQYKLAVMGDTAIDGTAYLTNGTQQAPGTISINYSGDNSDCYIKAGSSAGVWSAVQVTGNWNGSASTGGKVAFHTAGTERARIDTSGRLLVGTSSGSGDNLLQLQGSVNNGAGPGAISLRRGIAPASTGVNTTLGRFDFGPNDGGVGASIIASADAQQAANSYPSRLVFSTTADGASSPTERLRINSSGTTIAYRNTGTSGAAVIAVNSDVNGTNTEVAYFRADGGLANYSANNVNLSDRNTKKDIAPAAGTWDCLKQWEIVNYRYKDQANDADLHVGVIAQQVAETCPEVITVFQEATEDQPKKLGVKEQPMMWMAIKALQEAQLRIETLEAKVAALEGV
jgi:hypothetical protein